MYAKAKQPVRTESNNTKYKTSISGIEDLQDPKWRGFLSLFCIQAQTPLHMQEVHYFRDFFFLSLTHIVLWHFTTYLLACDSPHIDYTEHLIQVKNTLLMQIRVSKICHGMFVLAINQHILQPLFRLSKLFVECNLYLGHVLLWLCLACQLVGRPALPEAAAVVWEAASTTPDPS